MKYYLDAGTTYSKIIEVKSKKQKVKSDDNTFCLLPFAFCSNNDSAQQFKERKYYIIPSKLIKTLDIKFEKTCGHMINIPSPLGGEGRVRGSSENEIVALANGCKEKVSNNAMVLDLGSRDAKWIRFSHGKFKDMDWNTSCASSTGATVEMLLKFYDLNLDELTFNSTKFPVTCGIFGLEKIMDDISKGAEPAESVSKFIHGIAYNAWSFAKKPNKIYLSGGFCENTCFVDSLKNYCEVELLGRFVLCEGLIE